MVQNYIKSIDEMWWEDFWHNDKSPQRIKFNVFKESYFGEGIVVDFGEAS
ncbi:MAG: hypothetical protein IH948_09275 [Bacteroidetes bacterium]|nr:hypothetical protein [Bacteroidota bacterium]